MNDDGVNDALNDVTDDPRIFDLINEIEEDNKKINSKENIDKMMKFTKEMGK